MNFINIYNKNRKKKYLVQLSKNKIDLNKNTTALNILNNLFKCFPMKLNILPLITSSLPYKKALTI